MLNLLTLTREEGLEFETWGNSFKIRDNTGDERFPLLGEGEVYPRITGDEYIDLLMPVEDEEDNSDREVTMELGLTVDLSLDG